MVECGFVIKIAVASVEQQRSESPASMQSLKLENPETTKEMTSKDGIAPKMMSKGGGKGGWLKAPLSEAQEPHGEFTNRSKGCYHCGRIQIREKLMKYH